MCSLDKDAHITHFIKLLILGKKPAVDKRGIKIALFIPRIDKLIVHE